MEKGASVFFFDMDHTLINADCDVTWKYFVVRHGLVSKIVKAYDARNKNQNAE